MTPLRSASIDREMLGMLTAPGKGKGHLVVVLSDSFLQVPHQSIARFEKASWDCQVSAENSSM